MGWRGVDLDGTAAFFDPKKPYDPEYIGAPIPAMIRRIKHWIAKGNDVRIFTARVGGVPPAEEARARVVIDRWCLEHIGRVLPITAMKDVKMFELWDDRAVQVERNTGRRMDNIPDPELWHT